MKNNIEDRERRTFEIWTLFEQERWKESAPNQNQNWDVPLINEISTNNWLTREVIPTKVFKWNSLTVSINFAKNVFYQPYDYCASVNIVPLHWTFMNKYVWLFITTELSRQNQKYTYAYKTSKERLNATKILLPVDNQWNPDYKFMEDFIKEREKIKREKYRKYVESQIKILGEDWDFRERENY